MPYSRPGVYVSESPLRSNVSPTVGATGVVFVGTATRGPVDQPKLIDSWAAFRSVFGDLDSRHELGYSVYHYFANGGAQCYVKRVLTTTATASTAASTTVSADIDGDAPLEPLFTLTSKLLGTQGNTVSAIFNTGAIGPVAASVAITGQPTGAATVPLFTVVWKEKGTVGNSKTATVTTTTAGTGSAFPIFTITIGGGVVETVTGLTLDPTSANYVGNVNATNFRVINVATGLVPASNFTITGTAFTLTGGSQLGATANTATFDMALYKSGVLVETWDELSMIDTAANFVGTKLNDAVTGSKYVTASAIADDATIIKTNFDYGFGNGTTVTLTGGTDGAAIAASTFVTGNPTGSGLSNLFKATAKDKGVWGNSAKVTIAAGQVAASSTVLPTFSLTVKVDGAEVERWSELSMDPDSSRYVATILNNYSDYVSVSNVATVTPSGSFSYTAGDFSLLGGSDGTAVVNTDYINAFPALDIIDTDILINVPGVSNGTVVNGALSYAQGRGNGFVVIDPDPAVQTASEVLSITNTYTSAPGYGAVYYPAVTMVDPTKSGPGALRVTAPGGAILGAYIRSDRQRTVAKAPAGYSLDLRGVFALAKQFTEAEVGTLYSGNVNTLKVIPGAGAIIFGARTLEKTAPDMFIPIRRSLNFVKARMKEITSFAVFEPNDERLYSTIRTVITKELTNFWGKGGLKGNTADQAFYVVCDSTNNTSTSIAEGEVRVEVGLALQYPAEFIVINISQWSGGANAADTL